MLVPCLTRDLPGSSGRLLANPEDFVVHEILPYEASGEGEHLFVEIEKIGLTTPDATRRIARAAGISPRDVSFAGMKDKDARTRQWISLPLPIRAQVPDLSAALGESPDLMVLRAIRHRHKLKRGHQRGNRFTIRISDVPEGGTDRAIAVLERLRETGVPNAFGPQRFGREADNAARALSMVRGEWRGPRDRRMRTLLLSALQSDVFNRVLAARIERGLLTTALLGDVMQKHDTGGLFDVTDPAAEQPRVDALQISPTAALPGARARKAFGEPGKMEEAALQEVGLSEADLARIEPGTRRQLRYPLDPSATVTADGPSAYRLEVTLPSGAYATVLLAELMKPESGVVLREGDGSADEDAGGDDD